MAIRVIVDSTVDLGRDVIEECIVIPLTVCFGDKEYKDGIDLSKDAFYTLLAEEKELPRTSQAIPAVFAQTFEAVTNQGDEAIVLTVSAKLSGTYQSACIAAADYDNIRVVDTRNVAIGSGILAKLAIERIQDGKSLDEVVEIVEANRNKVNLIALLDTLTYLQKGGRISKTAALAGTVLNVKPVVCIKDGEIELLGKARGSKKANNFLNDEVSKSGVDYTMPILLGYSGHSDAMLQTYIEDSRSLWADRVAQLECVQIGTVVGTHAGPGAVAVAYFGG